MVPQNQGWREIEPKNTECSMCQIIIGGSYEMGSGETLRRETRIEQSFTKFGVFTLCSWCMASLRIKGWLSRAYKPEYVEVLFKDGTHCRLKESLWIAIVREETSWDEMKKLATTKDDFDA